MSQSGFRDRKDAEEYQELLNTLGLEDKETETFRNRAHRRFFFDIPETRFTLTIENEECLLHDVSVGGLSFYSNSQYETGKELNLDFDKKFNLKVSVVNSFPSQADPPDEGTFFRHGCRFLDEQDGYRCVVAVLKQYLMSLR